MNTPRMRHTLGRLLLLLGGVLTLCLALGQAILPFSDSLMRAFDGPDDWSTPLLVASSFAVAGVLALLSLYPFSGAGRVRRLPLLRTVLLVVGILFTYRGLSLPFEVADALGVVTSDVSVTWGGYVTSAGTLAVGLCYLAGVLLNWGPVSEMARVRDGVAA